MAADRGPGTDARPERLQVAPDGAVALLVPLWRYRLLLVGVMLAAGALSAVWSDRRGPSYEAAALFMAATPLPIPPAGQPVLTTEQLNQLVLTSYVANDVIDELHLPWTPQQMLETASVRPGFDPRYFELVVRTARAEQAVPLAQSFATHAADTVRRAMTLGSEAGEERLKLTLDAAAARLKRADDANVAGRAAAGLDRLEAELKVLVARRNPPASDTAIAEVVTRLNSAKLNLAGLDNASQLARIALWTASTQYEQAVQFRRAMAPGLVLVRMDTRPKTLTTRGRDALFGATAGLLLACAAVLAAHALRGPRRIQ